MSITRKIITTACLAACIGGPMAEAAGKLAIKINGGEATARITYATERVRQACTEAGVDGSRC